MNTKHKQIGIIIILVVLGVYISPQFLSLSPYTNGCYQEMANVATACGGLSTGTYTQIEGWLTPSNVNDGNWDTATGTNTGNALDYILTLKVSYAKPTGAVKATWVVKDSGNSYNGDIFDITIPSACFNQPKIDLWFSGIGPNTNQLGYKCYNGTSYQDMISARGINNWMNTFYEEGVWWDMGTTPTTCTTTCPIGQAQNAYPNCSCYTPTGGGGTNIVTGPTSVEPNTINTYNAILSEPYPGSYNPTLGVLTSRYCGMALVDSNNNVISDTGFTACTASYTKSWSMLIPNVQANFVVLAVMTETKQHYSGGSWVIDYTDKTIQTAALGITSKVTQQPIPVTAPADFGSIVQGLINVIAGIFAKLQEWLNNLFGLGLVLFLS